MKLHDSNSVDRVRVQPSDIKITFGFDLISEALDSPVINFVLEKFAQTTTEVHLGGKRERATCDFGIPAERHWGERHPPCQASHVGACIISKSILRIGNRSHEWGFGWIRQEPCDARKEAPGYRAAREPAIKDFNIHSPLRGFSATARSDSTTACRRLV